MRAHINIKSYYILKTSCCGLEVRKITIICLKSSGHHPWSALGIGQGCGGLGPLPVGGPIFFFMEGGIYRNIWFMGCIYS